MEGEWEIEWMSAHVMEEMRKWWQKNNKSGISYLKASRAFDSNILIHSRALLEAILSQLVTRLGGSQRRGTPLGPLAFWD